MLARHMQDMFTKNNKFSTNEIDYNAHSAFVFEAITFFSRMKINKYYKKSFVAFEIYSKLYFI